MSKNTIIMLAALVVLIVAGLGSWWYLSQEEETATEETEEITEEGNNNSLLDSINKAKEAAVKYQDITPVEAEALVDKNGDAIIIDVSSNYAQGHLLTAVNYPVGDGSLDEVIPSLDKVKSPLAYCHSDSTSA